MYDVRRDDAPLRKVAGVAGEFDKLRKIIRNVANGLRCMCSAAMSRRRRCCASSVLTLCIILFVNVFLMPLPDTPAGPLYSGLTTMSEGWNIAVLGATGAVGEALLETLAERQFPVGEILLWRATTARANICVLVASR